MPPASLSARRSGDALLPPVLQACVPVPGVPQARGECSGHSVPSYWNIHRVDRDRGWGFSGVTEPAKEGRGLPKFTQGLTRSPRSAALPCLPVTGHAASLANGLTMPTSWATGRPLQLRGGVWRSWCNAWSAAPHGAAVIIAKPTSFHLSLKECGWFLAFFMTCTSQGPQASEADPSHLMAPVAPIMHWLCPLVSWAIGLNLGETEFLCDFH